jgi:hypothetical protein
MGPKQLSHEEFDGVEEEEDEVRDDLTSNTVVGLYVDENVIPKRQLKSVKKSVQKSEKLVMNKGPDDCNLFNSLLRPSWFKLVFILVLGIMYHNERTKTIGTCRFFVQRWNPCIVVSVFLIMSFT